MQNNLIYQILKLEDNVSLKNIDFIKISDKQWLNFYIDASGFDIELVKTQMVELENLNKTWKKAKERQVLIGFITLGNILVDEQKIAFRMLKTDFIDFVIQEKLPINTSN